MRWRGKHGRILKQVALPVLSSCAIAYFGYHTVQGDRGLMAYLRISGEIDQAKSLYASLREEHVQLQHRVSLLGRGGLDPDLLDERARAVLNYAAPGELVFYYTDKNR
ncbi:MAG: hypothetical protein CMM50_03365 [Rhodospirillaceae bacterium]|jgi:cell division protein FtsB|nr:hypothetical protein [Rhodospirillaceae bacterium]|tara:strand:+ start:635 stop:958 length:324 start_codon:yes stop_codon:yes gene_type:complete